MCRRKFLHCHQGDRRERRCSNQQLLCSAFTGVSVCQPADGTICDPGRPDKQTYLPHSLREVAINRAWYGWRRGVNRRCCFDIDQCSIAVGVIIREFAVVPRVDGVAGSVVTGASAVIEVLAPACAVTAQIMINIWRCCTNNIPQRAYRSGYWSCWGGTCLSCTPGTPVVVVVCAALANVSFQVRSGVEWLAR
jgi:hypothetical protein